MREIYRIILIVLVLLSTIFADNFTDTTDLWIVESIRFRRMFPLFNSDIEPSLGFRRGAFVSEDLIQSRIPAIKQTMQDRGLRNVELRIETQKNYEAGSIIITIIKEKSDRSRVKAVKFTGNRRFSYGQLRRAMSAWKYKNRLLDKIELSGDLKNLQNKYHENAFADVVVRDSIIYDPNEKDASILVQIEEGRRYKVKIADRGALRKRQIRNEFDFTTGRSNRNDRIIRTARRNVENKLLGLGYSEGKVEISDTTIAKRRENIRRISLEIQAGERISLDSVEFVGNNFFSDDELLKTMKSKIAKNGRIKRNGTGSFVPKAIKDDEIMIENKYFKSGFLNVEVETKSEVSNNSAFVSVRINEGVQTIVSSINVGAYSIRPLFNIEEKIPLKTNTPLNPFAADTSAQLIRNFLSESGFVNARVVCRIEFNADSSLAFIHFDIDKGQKSVFGDIEFVGNFKTKDRYINKFLDIEKGEDFSNRRLSRNMRNLRKINAFRSVSSEVIPDEDTNNIRVSFDEVYPYVLNFSGGYNTEVLFYSKIKLTNRNFLGLNKIFSIGAGLSAKEYYAEANFLEPHFFNENLSLGIDLYYRNYEIVDKKFWSQAGGHSYGLTFRPNSVFSTGIKSGYEVRLLYPFRNFDYSGYEENDTIDIDVSLVNKTRHVLSTAPNATIDLRNSKIRPRKGGVLSGQVLVSHGLNSIQDNYIKAEAEARIFVPMSKFFTLALRSGSGLASPYGKNEKVAMDALFSIGGTSTIRGFREGKLWTKAVGDDDDFPELAYSALFNSAELRASFGAFEIPFFTDFGTISSENGGDFRPMRYSIGSGLRYITPIGPIGIVYAVPTDAASRAANSGYHRTGMTGVIHFSIGYSF